jgi:hypothetical protein
VKSLQSSCADHQPAESDLFFPHAGRLPGGGGVRGGSGWIILNWRQGIKVFILNWRAGI